jgi:CII-binding regulator of phage lambda lysogenization HflD
VPLNGFEVGSDLWDRKMEQSLEILDLDEKLTRYWLSCILPLEKRIKFEEHLQEILQKRQQITNAKNNVEI